MFRKADNVYANTDDKFVKGSVLYFKSADSILYYEAAYTNKVAKDELIDLFKKGEVIVKDGNDFVRPTALSIATDYASVTYTAFASSAASQKVYYSAGYAVAG